MGRFYKASSGCILCIENDEKLTQEEVDLTSFNKLHFQMNGKIKILMIKKRTRLDLVYAMGDKFK